MQIHRLPPPPNSLAILRILEDEDGLLAHMGVEVGSLSTFYSMDRPGLGEILSLAVTDSKEDGEDYIHAQVRLKDAYFNVFEGFSIHQATGSRRLRVQVTQPSYLMDSVIRFVFPLLRVKSVSIGGRVIPWQKRNHYHQYLAEDSLVCLTNGSRIIFRPKAVRTPKGMALFVYFRDEPDAWVFHIRMLAIQPTNTVVRGCNSWFNAPFSPFFQKIARAIPGFLDRTLYVRERVSQRIPFQTNGGILMLPKQWLEFSVEWEIEE